MMQTIVKSHLNGPEAVLAHLDLEIGKKILYNGCETIYGIMRHIRRYSYEKTVNKWST